MFVFIHLILDNLWLSRVIYRIKKLSMKIVKENINEAFTRNSDDKMETLGLGKKAKIMEDLKNAGIREQDVEITPDFQLIWRGRESYIGDNRPDEFFDIKIKYMQTAEADMARRIHYTEDNIISIIEDAWKVGLRKDKIMALIDEFTNEDRRRGLSVRDKKHVKAQATVTLSKLSRTKAEIKHDKEYNTYAFIGYTDKVPVMVDGRKYYEDKLGVEKIMKIDKFNISDLQNISLMKIRLQHQHYADGHVYLIDLPKDVLDGEDYNKIPPELEYIFDKYKRRG